ncbi:MAG TPA: PilZ domain-containing protein [Candidatus Tyrphobacter sp.]
MKPTSGEGPAERRRGDERVSDMLLVSYSIGEEFEPEFTETYDLSIGGMAMLTNAEIARDSPIFVTLELRSDPQPLLRLRGLVRWSRFDPMVEYYRTGVAFPEVDGEMRTHLRRYIDTLNLLRKMDVL